MKRNYGERFRSAAGGGYRLAESHHPHHHGSTGRSSPEGYTSPAGIGARFGQCATFFSLTPAPPPFSGMKTTPAASSAALMRCSVVPRGDRSLVSNRRTVAGAISDSSAKRSKVQHSKTRASWHCVADKAIGVPPDHHGSTLSWRDEICKVSGLDFRCCRCCRRPGRLLGTAKRIARTKARSAMTRG